MFTPLLEVIEAQLSETLSGLGEGPFPTFGRGLRDLDTQQAPPHVVFVPIGGQITASGADGSDAIGGTRALWLRKPTIAAHVYAADLEAVEILAGHLVTAIEACIPGRYRMVSESWDTKGITDNGVVGIFTFEVQMPFVREAQAEADVITLRILGGIA